MTVGQYQRERHGRWPPCHLSIDEEPWRRCREAPTVPGRAARRRTATAYMDETGVNRTHGRLSHMMA